MFRASVAILLTLAAGVRAQSTVTAKEAFLVQADAGVVGGYGFVAYPGQPKALTFKAGGPAYAVVLGGSSAGAVTPLMPDAGSNALGGTPDLLILATDSAYWGAFYQLLQVQPSTYALGPDNFGQAAHVTRDSGGRLRLMSYSAGVKLSRVTSAATLSSTGAITVAAPAVAGFLGKWLLSPPGSDLIYEWTDGWSQVRIADYSAVNPVFGNPYPVSGVQRARLYWAGGTTTYVVFTEGTTISIVQLGSSSVIPMGNFEVQLPGGAPSCPGCILTDLEIAQEGFPGYPDGAIIAVIANKSSAALLALVDWADVATLLNLGTRASTASAALLDPAAGGGGGGGGGGGPGGPVGAGGPYVGGSSSSGCSSSGGVMPPLRLAALLLGWALSRRSPSVR